MSVCLFVVFNGGLSWLGLDKGGGSPGDKFLSDMIDSVSTVFAEAGGGAGFSQEAKAFWKKLREMIVHHFEGNSGDIAKKAIPALTDAAISTRLTKIHSAKCRANRG